MKILHWLFFVSITATIVSFSTISNPKAIDNSYVKFAVKNAGIIVNGQFKSFYTNIKFNKANITGSIFNGVINVSSIDTDIKKRDEHLKKEDYFDIAKHTGIVFKSTSVASVNSSTLKVIGNLTIKATTRQVSLNVNYSTQDNNTIFTTKLNLNRRDYGVGGQSLILSDDISIDLKFMAKTTEL